VESGHNSDIAEVGRLTHQRDGVPVISGAARQTSGQRIGMISRALPAATSFVSSFAPLHPSESAVCWS